MKDNELPNMELLQLLTKDMFEVVTIEVARHSILLHLFELYKDEQFVFKTIKVNFIIKMGVGCGGQTFLKKCLRSFRKSAALSISEEMVSVCLFYRCQKFVKDSTKILL